MDRICRHYLQPITNSRFGHCGSTQRVALNVEFRLAVRALDICNVLETFDTEDVSKVNSVCEATVGAWSERNEFVFKDNTFGKAFGTCIDPRQAEDSKNDWVDSDDRFNELVAKEQPKCHKDKSSWKIEQVRSEVIFLHSDLAYSGVDVAFGFCLNGKLRSIFF